MQLRPTNQAPRQRFGSHSSALWISLLGSCVSAALLWLSVTAPALAANAASAKSGNWTDASTWVTGKVPASIDSVAISQGHVITIPAGQVVTNSGGIQVSQGTLLIKGTLNNGGELSVQPASAVSQNDGALVNTGTLRIMSCVFVNAGTLTNEKTLSVESDSYAAQLSNTATGVLKNKGVFNVLSILTNDGTFSNAGQFAVGVAGQQRPSKLEGAGAITNEATGKFVVFGNASGNGAFVNLGTLQIVNTGSGSQQGFSVRSTFENRGTVTAGFTMSIVATGTLTNRKEGTVNVQTMLPNNGRIENYGAIITPPNCPSCSVTNNNTLRSYCGGSLGPVTGNAPIVTPCAGADAGVPAPTPTPVAAGTYGTSLCSTVKGTTLVSGSYLTPLMAFKSPNQTYQLIFQTDGNAVLYQLLPTKTALWSSKTNGVSTVMLSVEADGNVMVKKPDYTAAWSTSTAGNPGAVLSLQDDGNLVVYRKDSCTALWGRTR